MCGIFGEFHTGVHRNLPADVFEKINDLNFQRGPDSGGRFDFENHVQLGFRRLAILDLSSAANQPMVSPDGRWAMVFNGEVYNHKKIKALLPEGKYAFKTTSDTEVILYAMDHFGPMEAVKLLDGMFAIGLVDLFKDELYLFRDFAGIKPLFYGIKSGSIVFGSQYDQITKHPLFQSEPVNQEVLSVFLRWHYVPAPLGMLENTGQLLPGSWLHVSKDGKVSQGNYWQFDPFRPSTISSEKEALEYLEQNLLESVELEMESDVPLGAFLSGGIDSPLVVSMAQEKVNGKLKAFSIGSDSKVHDESEDATWYAKNIGVEHHLEKMNAASALTILPEVLKTMRDPIADFSIIPTYLVSKLARKEVTVALSGDGGDELFFGYERFFSLGKNFNYLNDPLWKRKWAYYLNFKLLKNKKVNSAIFTQDLGAYHAELHSRFKPSKIRTVFSDFKEYFPDEAFFFSKNWNPKSEEELIQQVAFAEFYGMMQKTLVKVDRASMGVSLEVRVPFLLKSNIEKAIDISPWLSYGNGKKKEILKQLLRKRCPGAPIDERKRGFTIPLKSWINQELRSNFEEALYDQNFLQTFGFNSDGIKNLLNQHAQGVDEKWPLFTLFALSNWNNIRK
jgi:asparagine synthase (glutamine-hydrolysing)